MDLEFLEKHYESDSSDCYSIVLAGLLNDIPDKENSLGCAKYAESITELVYLAENEMIKKDILPQHFFPKKGENIMEFLLSIYEKTKSLEKNMKFMGIVASIRSIGKKEDHLILITNFRKLRNDKIVATIMDSGFEKNKLVYTAKLPWLVGKINSDYIKVPDLAGDTYAPSMIAIFGIQNAGKEAVQKHIQACNLLEKVERIMSVERKTSN